MHWTLDENRHSRAFRRIHVWRPPPQGLNWPAVSTHAPMGSELMIDMRHRYISGPQKWINGSASGMDWPHNRFASKTKALKKLAYIKPGGLYRRIIRKDCLLKKLVVTSALFSVSSPQSLHNRLSILLETINLSDPYLWKVCLHDYVRERKQGSTVNKPQRVRTAPRFPS